MTLLAFEGFDGSTSSDDLFAGVLQSLNATASSLVGPDPSTEFNGKSLGITTLDASGAASAAYVTLYAPTASATLIVGTSLNLSSSPTSGYDIGVSNGIQCQMFCRFILDQVLVYRGDPVTGTTVLIASGQTGLVSSGWAYIEIKATVATGTSGAVSIYINGASALNFTSLNTSFDGTATINGCVLGVYDGSGGGFRGHYDEVYVLDTLGTLPYNSFLGPTRVVMRVPASDSAVAFTPNANTNWRQVSETSFDGDQSYNAATSSNTTDLFAGTALPSTTTLVYAVQVKAALRKDDAGPRTAATVLKSGASTQTGSTTALSPTYQYISDLYVADPNTSLSWTTTTANASTFGYKVVS